MFVTFFFLKLVLIVITKKDLIQMKKKNAFLMYIICFSRNEKSTRWIDWGMKWPKRKDTGLAYSF